RTPAATEGSIATRCSRSCGGPSSTGPIDCSSSSAGSRSRRGRRFRTRSGPGPRRRRAASRAASGPPRTAAPRPPCLPGPGPTVQIRAVFPQAPNEFDPRLAVTPRVYTPLDSKSYRQGVDPAMAAILRPDTSASASEVVERAIVRGDSSAAERALTAARNKTVNRYLSLEREVNTLGYRLLSADKPEQALQVFRLNTRAYPTSANAFDSLGEALLGAGYRDAAIASYRKAVELEPGFPP